MLELTAPVPLGKVPVSARAADFKERRAFLERWFPRGRLRVNEEGEPCLVPIDKSLRHWQLTRDGGGVCIRWGSRRDHLLRATRGLQRRRPILDCGEEGFLYLEPCDELKGRLPMFSKRIVTDSQLKGLEKARRALGHKKS